MFVKIKRTFKRAAIAVIRARKQQAAIQLADYLVENNRDFRTHSKIDLAQKIAKGNLKDIQAAF